MSIIIYTDGSAKGNPGNGGYGIVMMSGSYRRELNQGFRLTTNNRMELSAVINALREVASAELDIYTDSKYVKNGIESWIKNWKINGWMTAAKQPVKNKDLWLELDTLVSEKVIGWKWVKGHSNDHYNTIVDEAARKAIR